MGNEAMTGTPVAALKPAAPAEELSAETIEFFESKIRPVLIQNCYECHGPEKQKAGLRLDSRDAILKGGEVTEIKNLLWQEVKSKLFRFTLFYHHNSFCQYSYFGFRFFYCVNFFF